MPSISKALCHNRSGRPVETTMIRGNMVNIEYANLSVNNHQEISKTPERKHALDLLRSNCSLAALVDANERYDPPRCAEETRCNIMQKLEDWIRHDNHRSPPSSMFWLYGGAGAGKSALAQTLAEKLKVNGSLAASFFFFKADVNRNDGDRLIPTLALQLVQSFQGLTTFVEEKVHANPDLFKKNRRTQMLELLIESLIKLSLDETDHERPMTDLRSHPRLVVIDGLDECCNPDIQCDLLRIIADATPHFPYPLRFLITSRPESHIARVFEHDLGNVARYNLSDDSAADQDIRTFLDTEFSEIRRTHLLRLHLPSQWPPPDAISTIADRSSDHFIYASTVIRFIQSPRHHPGDRLQVILGLKQPCVKDRPYARLDALYRLIFLEVKDHDHLEEVHSALGIMHLRSLKSGLFASPCWPSDRHAIEALLELRPGDLLLLFDRLLSLIAFDQNNIRIFHKSLFDYLLDSSRSEDLQLDLALAHEAAANHALRQKELLGHWNPEQHKAFVYHCQFARLNDATTAHLRSLACDPKMALNVFGPSEQSCLLQSMLYFLQVTGRQDFDPSGRIYRTYVEKKTQCLRKAVAWSLRLRCMLPRLTRFEVFWRFPDIRRSLRSSFRDFLGPIDTQPNGLSGRTPIPVVNIDVVDAIEREHEMFSSYVKALHRYPNIVISFLESNAELIHSCHFVFRALKVTFVILVTYTEDGVRLSCSEFRSSEHSRCYSVWSSGIRNLGRKHLRITRREVENNCTEVYSAIFIPICI